MVHLIWAISFHMCYWPPSLIQLLIINLILNMGKQLINSNMRTRSLSYRQDSSSASWLGSVVFCIIWRLPFSSSNFLLWDMAVFVDFDIIYSMVISCMYIFEQKVNSFSSFCSMWQDDGTDAQFLDPITYSDFISALVALWKRPFIVSFSKKKKRCGNNLEYFKVLFF